MKTSPKVLCLVIAAVISSCVKAGTTSNLFGSFADEHTIGLWLFDEIEYPHTTLTDASRYGYDLRLQKGGKLAAGRFGNALKVSAGSDHAVSFAGFVGSIPSDDMRGKDGAPSGLWGPTIAPEKILTTMADGDWTIEFRLKLQSVPPGDAVLVDLGHAYEPGFTVSVAPKAVSFDINNGYAGLEASCPTDAAKLGDGNWHHIALAYSKSLAEFSHYVDGRMQSSVEISKIAKQPTPEVIVPEDREHQSFGFTVSKSLEWRRQHRFNFTVGHDRQGKNQADGMVDELRISDVVRYSGDFAVPASFSRNYGPKAAKPAVANGPPLLFAPGSPKGPVRLGSRKHLFIDDAIIDRMENVKIACNPPTDRKDLNFRPGSSAWRPTVVDVDGKVYMYIPDSYGSEEGITRLRISEDGISFSKPNLGICEYEGSKDNDFILCGNPMYCMVFKDLNPDVTAEEKYKLTAWVANRGIYLYLSPDGIHWRRNETCMLPLVSGGDAETYWDDQRGVYVTFLKRDSSFNDEGCPGGGRRGVMFETKEVLKTWPFEVRPNPYFEGWPFPAVTCEGPVVFAVNKNGQIYRTRAMKYPWAPDTYLAFVWRFSDDDEHRQVDLGVSRDGVHWKFFADKTWYMTPGADEEVLSLYGLIRRGDELWQYFDFGGAHGGSKRRTYARLTQRLDGFVSLDATERGGAAVTQPFVYEGNKLTLNVNAKGSVRVALLDEGEMPIPGFDRKDCDVIRGDAVRHSVTWKGNPDVGRLAGKIVRLKFEMQDAKLYAFEFGR